MRELAFTGLIALAFGIGGRYATGHFGWFNAVNLALGGSALLGAALLALRRMGRARAPAFRGVLLRSFGRLGLALLGAVLLERGAALTHLQWDWTFERKYELAEATRGVLQDLCHRIDALLYFDNFDPRIRSTRMLLRTMAGTGCLHFETRRIDDHPEDEDRYGIGSSNTVVVRLRGASGPERWERVERPTEGTLYEALYRLRHRQEGLLWVAWGAGEGDLERTGASGYSGLAAALRTEGYKLHQFVSAALSEIPEEVDAVLWIDPERPLRPTALQALERYLEAGGRLVVLLEPGHQTGLETLLARWGLESPDDVVIDPASGPVEEDAPGVDPLVYRYDTRHPLARGLDENRMTFFRGTRGFRLRKPEVGDQIRGIAFASPRSWLTPDVGVLERREAPKPPPDAQRGYHPVVAAGEYRRAKQRKTRIVAFGDSDLASNHFLRTLYNLDLVLNAVHWAADREPAITLRPKSGVSGAMQFPLPLQNTLSAFQSLGLLLPELLLLAGALVWARRRSS